MLIHALFALGVASAAPPSMPHPDLALRLASVGDTVRVAARASFGIAIAPVPDRVRAMDYLQPGEGVMIAQITPGGAAEAAHLRAGDMILSVNGKRVDETTIFATLRDVPRGQMLRVEYVRDWKWQEVEVRLTP